MSNAVRSLPRRGLTLAASAALLALANTAQAQGAGASPALPQATAAGQNLVIKTKSTPPYAPDQTPGQEAAKQKPDEHGCLPPLYWNPQEGKCTATPPKLTDPLYAPVGRQAADGRGPAQPIEERRELPKGHVTLLRRGADPAAQTIEGMAQAPRQPAAPVPPQPCGPNARNATPAGVQLPRAPANSPC